MGAGSKSIALIFGICGVVMGAVGSLLGIAAALLTLFYINELVGWISRIQGYELFNPVFYGTSLPSELSFEALSFVLLTTIFISLLAGIVPAVKASMIRPAMILRAE
jgi:lipoprotein-releasing system permease protein